MSQQRIRLGDLLVEHKLISEGQLQAALEEQKKSGRKLGRVLIENGYVKEDTLLNLLSSQLKVPFVDLGVYQFQTEISKLIPETLARRYRVLALEEKGDSILVGMADPTNIFAYDEVVRVLKKPVSLAVVKESDLLHAIDKVYQREDELKSLASELGEELADNVFDLTTLNQSAAQSDAPVVKLIESIFEEAVKANASDIHIEPDEEVLRIRRRIDGVLHEQVMDEKRIAAALVSKLKLMAGVDISERFEISALTDRSDNLQWVRLIPKQKDTGFKEIRLGFGPKHLQGMELVDGFDQVTRLVFSNVKSGESLPKDSFRFVPPEGVDVVGDRG